MTMQTSVPQKPGSAGSALIMNVFLVMVVGGLGAALLFQATSETRSNANFRTAVQAFYAAKSGLEEARARIPVLSSNPLTLPSTVSSVVYITHDSGVAPTNT